MSPSVALGIDIGGTTVKLAAIDGHGDLLARSSIPTPPCTDPPAFIEQLADVARSLLRDQPGPAGTGISVAGLLNEERDRVVFNPNLPWLEHFPLLDAIRRAFPGPAVLENDGNAAAIGEFHFGSGAGAGRLLMLVAGTGLGGAMLQDGRPLRFTHGGIGDPGHVMVEPGGPSCSAGCRGCAEALISVAALERRARVRGQQWTAPEITNLALAGNETARSIFDECGQALGLAAATLCAVFQPDVIVIGGGLAAAGDALLVPAESAMRAAGGSYYVEHVAFRKAALGDLSAAIGAAALVLPPSQCSYGQL